MLTSQFEMSINVNVKESTIYTLKIIYDKHAPNYNLQLDKIVKFETYLKRVSSTCAIFLEEGGLNLSIFNQLSERT